MHRLELTDREWGVLQMAIDNCLQNCQEGGPNSGCEDCATLENVRNKLLDSEK